MAKQENPKRPLLKWVLVLAVVLVLMVAALGILAIYAQPILHARALNMLRSRFEGQVEIRDFQISLFPVPRVTGS